MSHPGTDPDWLTGRFEQHRPHLIAVAHRMLGSRAEAEDAVQEAWLRLHRSDTAAVTNLGGWLTTVVGRVCLDLLRARASRREDPGGPEMASTLPDTRPAPDEQALLGDAVGLALQVVLDALTPAERLAFVLHDLFAVPFDEIAPIVGRTPAAARQLASRARRRVQGAGPGDLPAQRAIVDAFLAASRAGDFDALLALLDPDVELRADPLSVATATANQSLGAPALAPRLTGADAVARSFLGRARTVVPALIAAPTAVTIGAAWAPGGVPRAVFLITVAAARITGIELIADPARIATLDVTPLP
jgi:RNA polymerase sigma-70 factor (ECF subfamily)